MANPRDVLHEAQVSSNNVDSASSRVAYDDLNGHVSSDTQTIFPAMGRWQMFFLPKVGDHVAVLRLPNGKQEGFVVGTYNTAENMPINPADGLVQLVSEDLKNMIQMFATEGNFNIKFREKMHQKCKNSEINVIENIKQTSETWDTVTDTAVTHKSDTLDINADSTIIVVAGDAYHLLIDAKENFVTLDVKNIEDSENPKDTINLKIDGNDGEVNVKTTNVDTQKKTTDFTLNGKNSNIDLTMNNPYSGNETISFKKNGETGQIDLETNGESSDINVTTKGNVGNININAHGTTGELNIDTLGDINVHTAKNINIKSDINLNIQVGGSTTIDSGGAISINSGAAINMTADVNITGNLTLVNEDVILNTHRHGGVQTGSGVTNIPQS